MSLLARLRPERVAAKAVRTFVSTSTKHRGRFEADGRITLLTVDYHLTDDVVRLGRSFRRFIDADGTAVVVQNGRWSDNRRLRRDGWVTRGFGLNLNHGTGLDLGLRSVKSEFVLICDPDSVIVSPSFGTELLSRLEQFGVAGIVLSSDPTHARYHPICVAFRTELWKGGDWSMNPDWERGSLWDVGAAVTEQTGGLHRGATLPLTRQTHDLGYLWADSFSNVVAAGRLGGLTDDDIVDGRRVGDSRAYYRRWRAWGDQVVEGAASATSFPEFEPD